MVIPKSSGGTKTAKKTTIKKTTTTKKPTTSKKPTTLKKPKTTRKTSPKSTQKSDEVLKQRLKKMLEKEYASTSTKSKTLSTSGNCQPSESKNIRDLFTSDVQKFVLNAAKKEALGKSTKKDDPFFKKQDKNKNSTSTAKKTTGTTKKAASSSRCPDGTCPIVKKTTTVAKKATATGTKRKATTTKGPAKKPRASAAGKNTAAKKACGTGCGCSSRDDCTTGRCGPRSRGGCCGDDTDDSDSDDDNDDSSSYDDSDSDGWSDSDSSDDGGCGGGGACGPASKRGGGGGGRGRTRRRESSSGSDCPDGRCPFVRRRPDWQCEDITQPINNGNSNDADKSLVPYTSQSSTEDASTSEIADDSFEGSSDYSSYESDSSDSSIDENEYDDSSFDDYSSDDSDQDYSFGDDSSDEEYQLPDDENEDLYIGRGEAKIYEVNSEQVQFDSDDSSSQIFEIPTVENGVADSNHKNEESDDSCPQLVPIDYKNLNGGGQQGDEYSTFSDDDSSSFDESEEVEKKKQPPNMIPEIFMADNSIMDESFGQNFSLLEKSFDDSDNLVDTTIDYFSSLKKITTNDTTTKYNVVTIEQPTEELPPGKLDQSQVVEVVEPIDSKFYNSLNSYQVLLLLKNTIYFHGTLKIKLLAGSIDIFGYTMAIDETVETYSPRGNNLLFLQPRTKTRPIVKNQLQKNLEILSKDFMTSDLNDLLKEYDQQNDAIVLLERNDRDKKIDMIKKYMKENVFPTTPNITNAYYHSEVILRCRFHTQCYNSLRINPKWNSVQVTTTSKLLIIGGKGVGKSTFLRYIINKNLAKSKRFLLIDLDIGQSEIFLPQTISATLITRPILGPGYFYDLMPAKSYLFGDINAILSPLSYISNVKQLLKYCREENDFKNVPWIINTMGYNKGFGSELISVIIENLRPTDVVQLQSFKRYNNFDCVISPNYVQSIRRNIFIDEPCCEEIPYNLFIIDSAVPHKKSTSHGEWDMLPKDIRFCMILSKLGNLMSERDEWLTDVKPYCVPIDDLNIICFSDDSVTKTDLLEVVNGNLVYLCNNSSPNIECYGIGIVRGIDMFQQKLYILPSTSPQTLINVNTIAVCNIPLPSSILLNQGPKIKGLVPYTYNTDVFMSSKHVPNNIYRPQHFLQGSHKPILNE